MSGFRLEGNTSGHVAEVDAASNLQVALPTNPAYAGFGQLAGTLSEETDPAGRIVEKARMSAQGRIAMGEPVPLFNEAFAYSAVNTGLFSQAATTQTITVGGGTLNLNASGLTTINTNSRVATYAFFPLMADFATYCVFDMALSAAPVPNCTVEAGFGQGSAGSVPTDGAFFRYDATGTLKAVLNSNGTEFTSSALAAPSPAVMHEYKIVCENNRVLYYIDGACQAVLYGPTGLGLPTFTQAQPWFCQVINGATAPSVAITPKIGYVYVGLQDAVGLGRSMADFAALSGSHGSQGASGQTMGSTAKLTNSMAISAAAMTNTTAALGTGLGGQFTANPTLAANTDGIVCSFQNPAASAGVPGKTLYIRGVKIQGVVTAALTGGPVVYLYSLAYGHTALSLATAEAAGTKAPRRVALGIENWAATAAVGALGSQGGAYMPFNAPIAVNPGEYVAITAKNLGVVTTAGAITFSVTFDAFWG